MKIKKKRQQRGIEDGIEAPSPDSGAPRPGEMQVQHPTRNRKAENELDYLAVCDGALPPGAYPDGAEEVVGVHEDVDAGVGDEGDGEE